MGLLCILTMDGLQGPLPHNTAPWQIEYCILAEGVWENGKTRKVILTSPCPSSLKSGDKSPMWEISFWTRGKGDILITRDRELGLEKSMQIDLVELTLVFLVTSSLFTTPSPNPFASSQIYCFRSKRCKSHFFRSSFANEGSHVHVKI